MPLTVRLLSGAKVTTVPDDASDAEIEEAASDKRFGTIWFRRNGKRALRGHSHDAKIISRTDADVFVGFIPTSSMYGTFGYTAVFDPCNPYELEGGMTPEFALKVLDVCCRWTPPLHYLRDREFATQACTFSSHLFAIVPFEFSEDKEFVLEVLRRQAEMFARRRQDCEDTSPDDDRTSLVADLQESGSPLSHINAALAGDRDVKLAAVRANTLSALGALPFSDTEDKELMIAAVRTNGHALWFARGALATDKEIVLAALRQTPAARKHLEPCMEDDEDVRAFLARIDANGDAQ